MSIDGTDPILDPFDPQALRLSQDFATTAVVKKLLNAVPVRKPGRQDFIRVHPSPDYRLTTAVIELREDREVFLVAPAVRDDLATEIIPVTLFTGITRQGVLFIWSCTLPGADGKTNRWHESALDAAERVLAPIWGLSHTRSMRRPGSFLTLNGPITRSAKSWRSRS